MEPNTEWGASGHDTTAWQGSLSPPELEARLSHMLAYRELCRAVQRSGRENFFFAALMAFFAHLSWQNGGANNFFLLVYGVFIIGELGIALYKWLWPSAEGVLGDALVMLAFALLNGLLAYVQFQAGLGPNPILAFLTGLSLLATWRHWQAYRHLRQLFSIRPTRQQLRWLRGLCVISVKRIRTPIRRSWTCRRSRVSRFYCWDLW
ncbi:MAG: hypothetical protein RMJ88_12250 [Thermogemmata sp.]|nr:hypothetical protein [Thermogemmata sp.]